MLQCSSQEPDVVTYQPLGLLSTIRARRLGFYDDLAHQHIIEAMLRWKAVFHLMTPWKMAKKTGPPCPGFRSAKKSSR